MKGIGDFLKRFANFTTPTLLTKRAVAQVVGELFSTSFSEEDVSIRDGVALIRASGALKSEILLQRDVVLSRVQKTLGGASVRDIR